MSDLTERYVRRPLYVDAVEVKEDNFLAVAEWCQGEIRTTSDDKPIVKEDFEAYDVADLYIFVRVHHPKTPKQTHAKLADWILYAAEQRGYKVYTPRAFETNFDLVDDTMDDGFGPGEEEEHENGATLAPEPEATTE